MARHNANELIGFLAEANPLAFAEILRSAPPQVAAKIQPGEITLGSARLERDDEEAVVQVEVEVALASGAALGERVEKMRKVIRDRARKYILISTRTDYLTALLSLITTLAAILAPKEPLASIIPAVLTLATACLAIYLKSSRGPVDGSASWIDLWRKIEELAAKFHTLCNELDRMREAGLPLKPMSDRVTALNEIMRELRVLLADAELGS